MSNELEKKGLQRKNIFLPFHAVYNRSKGCDPMEKSSLKHVLTLLDNYEIRGIDFQQAVDDVYDQLRQESHRHPSKNQISDQITQIIDAGMMRKLTRGYDVTPNATVFARSSIHSVLEDLALFSCMISNADDPDAFAKMVSAPFSFSQLQQHCAPLYCEMAHQSRLFQPLQNEQMVIPSALRHDCERIIEEYCYGSPPLVSPTVLCYYLKTIYPSSKEHWKNMDREIVPYAYLDEILTLLPRRGIPNNRDESKQLQSFYKDTLFHEFDHQCPICGIDLPHMLIASHIKPFRDCAHLYEPIDNNNGLLLCRNHDYLFDQGYISFNDDGFLLISKELKKTRSYREMYHLPLNFKLDERLLTKERKLFLQYHRSHIFRR